MKLPDESWWSVTKAHYAPMGKKIHSYLGEVGLPIVMVPSDLFGWFRSLPSRSKYARNSRYRLLVDITAAITMIVAIALSGAYLLSSLTNQSSPEALTPPDNGTAYVTSTPETSATHRKTSSPTPTPRSTSSPSPKSSPSLKPPFGITLEAACKVSFGEGAKLVDDDELASMSDLPHCYSIHASTGDIKAQKGTSPSQLTAACKARWGPAIARGNPPVCLIATSMVMDWVCNRVAPDHNPSLVARLSDNQWSCHQPKP